MIGLILSALLATSVARAQPGFVVTEGVLADVRFLETVTPGAKTSAPLPLVIALHPQGGSPADFLAFFGGLSGRARIILPAADEKNGRWSWYRGNSTDTGASGPRLAAKRLKPFLAQIIATRPTVGKPIVVGYSQGAIVALTMAVTESATLGTVVSISGRLPPSLFPEVRGAAPGPTVEAFHGRLDRAVPYAACQKSIATFKAAGFPAKLTSYPDVGHEITPEEAVQALGTVDRAAVEASQKP
jgi:phospholipase/carboxylesterase